MMRIQPIACAMAAASLLASAMAIADAAPGSTMIAEHQWTTSTNGDDLPWAEAERYCETLELDGYDDWRLPTQAELESLRDPTKEQGLPSEIDLDGCCIWSATSVAERPTDEGGPPGAQPAHYFWGMIFDGGIAYYSNQRFADGRALCVRDLDHRRPADYQ